jgi:hypothetical protein
MRRFARFTLGPAALLAAGLVASPALAQNQATTVQLPSFSSFSVSTSVSVPDRGGAFLGGTKTSSNGSTHYGPFPGARASGSNTGASNAWVFVHIHDHEALDAATLAAARGSSPAAPGPGELTSRLKQTAPEAAPLGGLAAARAKHATQVAAATQYVTEQIARADALAAAGKLDSAEVIYRMALKRADSAQRRDLDRRIVDLRARRPAPAVARRP